MSLQIFIGFCLSVLVSAGAVATGSLTLRAAGVSIVLGTVVFAAGGIAWSIPLLTFFATSSLLSRGGSQSDRRAPRERDVPGRTARQVMANGLIPALWAACQISHPGRIWALLYAAAVATAAADTWATEIGRRSNTQPRDIRTRRRVRPGTSGGITPSGVAASLAGSAIVVAACVLPGVLDHADAMAATLAGFGGALVDSWLGSALQERRWCPACSLQTEEKVHSRCLTQTMHEHGIPGFDNDWVNLTACFAAGSLVLVLRIVV